MCSTSLVQIAPYICVTYLSDMYEYKYDTSTRLIRVQFIAQPSLEIATCFLGCDGYELYLAGLLH